LDKVYGKGSNKARASESIEFIKKYDPALMKNLLVISLVFFTFQLKGQNISNSKYYEQAFLELKGMLVEDINPSFKRAVFITENAYLDNRLSYKTFNTTILFYAALCSKISEHGNLQYSESDLDDVKKYWSVYRLMTDSVPLPLDSNSYFVTKPFKYDFEDFWGEKNWRKMFVTKLLETNTGNCHSLPFLYKILCEELGVQAWLSMAPNHTYIKLWTKKIGWFNTELTSGYFPIDAWIMASGYIHLSAVQNRVFMDTLSLKQSIAVCLTDLAKGYEKKFGSKDLNFISRCTDLALQHYPLYTNALILKAETMKKEFENTMAVHGAKYPADIFNIPEAKKLFEDMEKLYFHIYEIGYRPMPKEMYVAWLADLNKEREKYANKNVINSFKSNH
jgi:hypothetical protein